MLKIAFLGAAREVTGSCFMVEAAGSRFLVDHGMFQGLEADRRNRAALTFDPRKIDFVLLTHAHIDHSGLLPRLASRGFRGPIYATPATCDLLEVMLPDAAHIQERSADRNHGRRGASEMLYTLAHAQAALELLRPARYDERVEPGRGLAYRFRDAGHILGSAIVELWAADGGRETKIVFSGDIGQSARPVVRDPTLIEEADVLIVESTYGNRLHKNLADTETELADIITETLGRGRGNVVIPAFAVGRTQEILHVLADLARREQVPRGLEVYVDSPMATKATEVTLRHLDLIDEETRGLIAWGGSHTGDRALHVEFTESLEESMRLNAIKSGAIIISASGMCDAGRIRHHLKHNLPRAGSAIVFTGFQAEGTLGRRLVDGATHVRLFGDEIPVRARIATIGGLSAHADRSGLLAWLKGFRKPPARTFVVHGEVATALGFAETIRMELGWKVDAPQAGEVVDLAFSPPAA